MRRLRVESVVVLAVGVIFAAPRLGAQATAELDEYWAEVSRTVAEGDFEGYAALYHADAVMVTNFSGETYPIATALEGWEQGFVDTASGMTTTSVHFRFSQRLNDGTTAHETGIFNHRLETASGDVTDRYVHFEAMLVKKDRWLMLMEYQKAPATPEEWRALPSPLK